MRIGYKNINVCNGDRYYETPCMIPKLMIGWTYFPPIMSLSNCVRNLSHRRPFNTIFVSHACDFINLLLYTVYCYVISAMVATRKHEK